MSFFSDTVAGLTFGLAAFGLSKQFSGQKKAQRLARQSTELANQRFQAQAEASRKISLEKQKQEDIRKKQLTLDSARNRRNIIRRAQLQRSLVVNNAAASGGLFSSSKQGGVAQVLGGAGANLVANQQNTDLGLQVFDSNQNIFDIQSAFNQQNSQFNQQQASLQQGIADAQGSAQLGSQIFQLSTSLAGNSQQIGRVLGTGFIPSGQNFSPVINKV